MNIRIATSAILALASVASMAQAQTYTMQEIATGGGNCINNGGLVVGVAGNSTATQKAFCFDTTGGLVHLPLTGVYNSQALGVSASNEVVGTATASDLRSVRGFLIGGSGVTWISNGFGGNNVMPYATNGSIVVGQANNAQRQSLPFKFESGSMTSLGTLGGPGGVATDVSGSGVIVGHSRISPSNFAMHAFRYSGSSMSDLGTLNAGNAGSSWAYAVNGAGAVVGTADSPSGRVAVKWPASGPAVALTSGPGIAYDINSAGVSVGQSGSGSTFAFVNYGSGPVNLNTVVSNLNGWSLIAARSINDSGKIVATGLKGSDIKTFLLTP